MALPTGSGSEILRSGVFNCLTNNDTSFNFGGGISAFSTNNTVFPALSIVTILNIVYCEMADADELIDLYVYKSSNQCNILNNASLPAKSTFVFSDRLVLMAGDRVTTNLASAGTADVYFSYILQDWS